MMNIVSWYEKNRWYTVIFPRERHRPSCFYAEGSDHMLISPAAVDMGGVITTPLEKDFDKITEKDIKTIFEEVCISDRKMQAIIEKLKSK